MSRTLQEALEYYRQKPWVVPKDVILAFSEAHPINEVLLNGPLRYRLTREISRDEFVAQLRKNKLHSDCVSAVAPAEGSKIKAGESREMDAPDKKFTHFYRAECI